MKIPRFLICAGASGSGKTLITCGLLQALINRDKKVASFKCGPDYIDPMFHSRVIGTKSRNLDSFFETGTHMRQKLSRSMEHISWGAEDDQLGPFHGSKDRGKCRSSAAFLLLSFDTGIASHANMGHVPWQLKLKKLIVRQKLPDEQPGNIIGT